MRALKTFILRLYTDTDLQNQFCGDIQTLQKSNPYPFKNKTELLHLIQNLADEKAGEASSKDLWDKNPLNKV